MRDLRVSVKSDEFDGLLRSEDGEGGLDVRRIDLRERFGNAMRVARDMKGFCKRHKSAN
jgi:hypothetical protein